LRDEAGGTDNVERGDTEECLGIVDAFGLVDFSADRNRRVDLPQSNIGQYGQEGEMDLSTNRIGNDKKFSFWRCIRGRFSQITDNRGVGVEQVCSKF
jgi:hypothetical protein